MLILDIHGLDSALCCSRNACESEVGTFPADVVGSQVVGADEESMLEVRLLLFYGVDDDDRLLDSELRNVLLADVGYGTLAHLGSLHLGVEAVELGLSVEVWRGIECRIDADGFTHVGDIGGGDDVALCLAALDECLESLGALRIFLVDQFPDTHQLGIFGIAQVNNHEVFLLA